MEFYCVFWEILSPTFAIVWAMSIGEWSAPAVVEVSHADVSHPYQTYAVPGRTMFDSLYLIQDLLELGCRDGLLFVLLSLDQEKVFDRVDPKYLLGLLQPFSFRPQLEGFLQVLYSSMECLVKLNWNLSTLCERCVKAVCCQASCRLWPLSPSSIGG
ncbi:unnamed protein product [Caretta caretta]